MSYSFVVKKEGIYERERWFLVLRAEDSHNNRTTCESEAVEKKNEEIEFLMFYYC
jgi:hypothetical protein